MLEAADQICCLCLPFYAAISLMKGNIKRSNENKKNAMELDFSAIPKLNGHTNLNQWKSLLSAYLEANDLWKDNRPIPVSWFLSNNWVNIDFNLFADSACQIHSIVNTGELCDWTMFWWIQRHRNISFFNTPLQLTRLRDSKYCSCYETWVKKKYEKMRSPLKY